MLNRLTKRQPVDPSERVHDYAVTLHVSNNNVHLDKRYEVEARNAYEATNAAKRVANGEGLEVHATRALVRKGTGA